MKSEEVKRRSLQSEREKLDAHIRVVNNGYLFKTNAGWFVCKDQDELLLKLKGYLDYAKRQVIKQP